MSSDTNQSFFCKKKGGEELTYKKIMGVTFFLISKRNEHFFLKPVEAFKKNVRSCLLKKIN
jgi:hypothetical protein